MKIYTGTGDRGETGLLSGQRVGKDHLRVEVYGSMDEACSAMGLAKAMVTLPAASELLDRLQGEILMLNADLATETTGPDWRFRITETHVRGLEQAIDDLERVRIPQQGFVLPGVTRGGAALDLARTIVRRAERAAVRLNRSSYVHPPALVYLNRLSDLLFVLARYVDQEELVAEATHRVLARAGSCGQLSEQPKERENMLQQAKAALAAAEAKAAEIGVPMVIAVVDEGGNLVAQQRMDGALLASIPIALDKAYTAVALKMPTAQAATLAQPGQPLFGIHTVNGGRIIIFGGGLPVIRDGRVVAGIGVSGGDVEQDVAVAQAAAAVWTL